MDDKGNWRPFFVWPLSVIALMFVTAISANSWNGDTAESDAQENQLRTTLHNRQLSVTADAGGPYAGSEGAAIALDASGTGQPDMVAEYRWDCTGDGTFEKRSSDPTGSTCTYDDDGDYSLKLRTIDIFDQTSEDVALVTVSNVSPTVEAGPDQTTDSGASIVFSGSFTDPGTADTHHIAWDFGDGSKSWGTLRPHHTYTTAGRYTVTLTVTDDDGGAGSAAMTVDVVNGPPKVDGVKVSPPVINEGERIILSGLLSNPEPGHMSLLIDWRDVQTQTMKLSPGCTCFSVSHTYLDDPPGAAEGETYQIMLTLSDEQGASSVKTTAIEVRNVAPTIDAGPDQRAVMGHAVAFSAAISDPGVIDTHAVTWDFGDGSVPVTGAEAMHVFAHPGSFTVTAIAEDDDGGIGEDALSVVITEFFSVHLPVILR